MNYNMMVGALDALNKRARNLENDNVKKDTTIKKLKEEIHAMDDRIDGLEARLKEMEERYGSAEE